MYHHYYFFLRKSRGLITKKVWEGVYQLAKSKVKRQYKLELPITICIKYPMGAKLSEVQHIYHSILKKAPVSRE